MSEETFEDKFITLFNHFNNVDAPMWGDDDHFKPKYSEWRISECCVDKKLYDEEIAMWKARFEKSEQLYNNLASSDFVDIEEHPKYKDLKEKLADRDNEILELVTENNKLREQLKVWEDNSKAFKK